MVSYIPYWLVNYIFSNDREPAPTTAQQFIYLDKTSTMTGQTDMQGEWQKPHKPPLLHEESQESMAVKKWAFSLPQFLSL